MTSLYHSYDSCPAKMDHGDTSIKTDRRSKNDRFYEMKGNHKNSFEYREYLQKNGLSELSDSKKYNSCNVQNCNITPSKEMKLNIDSTGNLNNFFKLLRAK